MQRHAWRVLQQTEQALSDVVEFDHLPEGINVVILRIESHKTGMAAIADVNGVNRRGALGNRLPDAQARQVLTGALRQRNRAGIKAGMLCRLWRNGFHQMNRELAARQL
ncbi:hypothetical protein D3C72_1821640 [compost metagenome]